MGKSVSKSRSPNNPFELELHNREQHMMRRKHNRQQEQERKKRKDEKVQKNKAKIAKLEIPKAPYVPKKIDDGIYINYEEEAKRRMQDQLACDSETFILNQLMLSVQFFGSYEKELRDAIERCRILENEQTRLIEKHCKIVILPDVLMDALDKRIKYKTKGTFGRTIKSSLQIPSRYIVHENIEITNPGDRSVYSTITNAPIYKMEIDITSEMDTHVGYVRLKNTELINSPPLDRCKSQSSVELRKMASVESLDEEDEDTYLSNKINSKHRDSILVVSKQKKRFQQLYNNSQNSYHNGYSSLSNSTGSLSPSSSDYDYVYTTVNTRQPLSAIKTCTSCKEPFSTTILPDNCISTVPVPSVISDESEDSTENDQTYEVKQYLSSKAFLSYFLSLFHDVIASDLDISSEELADTYWKSATIYSPNWETIPAISCPWPNEAFEWIHRQREIKENPKTRQKFQWPTPVMVNKVVSMGCHVIPMGCIPKLEVNLHRDIEWKIIFPEAERYLQSCLTNAQAKVFIMAKILILTYVEPFIDAKQYTFTMEHLRTHLFWQCENNYAAWPEDYLGEALIRFLNSLLDCIKRQKLPDYFLPKRNLFENIPEKVLVELHKRIFRITENPLMHLIIALRNLSYDGGPETKIPFKKLYSILAIDDPLKILNPLFRNGDQTSNDENGDEETMNGRSSDSDDAVGGVIGYFQESDKNDRSRKRRTKKVHFMETEKFCKTKKDEENGQGKPTDFFDLKFRVGKHLELIRRRLIYKFFINHFMEMSKELCIFKSYNQSLIYLGQAIRICKLLQDDGDEDEAKTLLQQIDEQCSKTQIERNRESKTKPQLPRRESVFESTNRYKFKARKSIKLPDDYDPYANVDPLKSPRIKSIGSEESLGKISNGNTNGHSESPSNIRFSRSISTSPKINRMRKPSAKILVSNIQVHDQPLPSASQSPVSYSAARDNVFFPALSPHSPQVPIKSVNFFSETSSIYTTGTPTAKKSAHFFSESNGEFMKPKSSILKKRMNSVKSGRSIFSSMNDLESVASMNSVVERKDYLRSRTTSSDTVSSVFATDL